MIERSPYLLALCAVMVAVGHWLELLPIGSAMILFCAGLVNTRLWLLRFRPGGEHHLRALILFSPAVYPLAFPHHANDLPWTICMGMVAYMAACKWGTTFLLFCLFREPFLHFIETPDRQTVLMDNSAAQLSGVPSQEFDY